jgi:hypothetical protein
MNRFDTWIEHVVYGALVQKLNNALLGLGDDRCLNVIKVARRGSRVLVPEIGHRLRVMHPRFSSNITHPCINFGRASWPVKSSAQS